MNRAFQSKRGFTIVELLIVIVVIGILASITIVAYNGLTKRANALSGNTNATNIKKLADLYVMDPANSGSYPTLSQINSYSTYGSIPSGVTLTTSQLTSAHENGKTIQYMQVSTSTNSGVCIGYWDSAKTPAAATYIYAGTMNLNAANNSFPICSV